LPPARPFSKGNPAIVAAFAPDMEIEAPPENTEPAHIDREAIAKMEAFTGFGAPAPHWRAPFTQHAAFQEGVAGCSSSGRLV
jgi:hypothetical protein